MKDEVKLFIATEDGPLLIDSWEYKSESDNYKQLRAWYEKNPGASLTLQSTPSFKTRLAEIKDALANGGCFGRCCRGNDDIEWLVEQLEGRRKGVERAK